MGQGCIIPGPGLHPAVDCDAPSGLVMEFIINIRAIVLLGEIIDPNSDCTVGVQDFEPVRLGIKTKYKQTKTEKPDPNPPTAM